MTAAAPWVLRCPVCATPVPPAAHPTVACPTCGLPAVVHAGTVVGRIGATLVELQRDRDALLATLRGCAAGGRARPAAPAPSTTRVPGPAGPSVSGPVPVPATPDPPGPMPAPPTAHRPGGDDAVAPAGRRISPQQVLVGLGGLLVVAAALALVAVGWTRFGVGFQAAVMVTATATAAGCSAWAARRGLRATEEGLAALATSLLVIDAAAARALGFLDLDRVDGRLYGAVAAGVVAAVAAALGRASRSTLVWPAAALFAAQPVVFLALGDLVTGVLGVVALLLVAAADAGVAGRLPRWAGEVARLLAGLSAAGAALLGTALGWTAPLPEGAPATAVLAAAAAGGIVLVVRRARSSRPVLAGVAALTAVPALALAGVVQVVGGVAAPLLTHTGLALASAAVLLRAHPVAREVAGGPAVALVVVGTVQLLDADRTAALAAVALAAVVPAALVAVLVRRARPAGTGLSLALPGLAVLAARDAGVIAAPAAGLLLATLAALALGLATVRLGHPEERAAALTAPVLGLAAAATGATVGAWGQVGVQLALVGGAGLGYALAGHRAVVRWIALADLVVAGWVALAGAEVTTPEAYSLPLAAALLAAAGPRLLRGPSWEAWGPALLVGFAPSVVTALGDDGPVRVLLVIGAGVVAVVAGTLTHRQAPFLVGAVSAGLLGAAELAPVVSRLATWVPLGAAGLLLLLLGATYERRRQQAREAVAWVAQMG